MSEHDDALIAELKQHGLAQQRDSEPDWSAMSRAISDECDAIEERGNRSWLTLLFGWRPLHYGVAVAAAALLIFVGVSQLSGNSSMAGDRLAKVINPNTAVTVKSAKTADLERFPRTEEVGDLDPSELDELSARLQNAFSEEDAEWLGSTDPASGELLAPDDSLLPEPNYEQFVDDLDDEQVDAVHDYLASVKAG